MTYTKLAAVFLGTAGFLSASYFRQTMAVRKDSYFYRLRREWRRIRHTYGFLQELDPGIWRFFRQRPVSFPIRRLGNVLHFLRRLVIKENYAQVVLRTGNDILTSCSSPVTGFLTLLEFVRRECALPANRYWSRHSNFSQPSVRQRFLFGKDVCREFVINWFIPFLIVYTKDSHLPGRKNMLYALVENCGSCQSNFRLRTVGKQIFGRQQEGFRRWCRDGCVRLGAIELHRKYSVNGKCAECPLNT